MYSHHCKLFNRYQPRPPFRYMTRRPSTCWCGPTMTGMYRAWKLYNVSWRVPRLLWLHLCTIFPRTTHILMLSMTSCTVTSLGTWPPSSTTMRSTSPRTPVESLGRCKVQTAKITSGSSRKIQMWTAWPMQSTPPARNDGTQRAMSWSFGTCTFSMGIAISSACTPRTEVVLQHPWRCAAMASCCSPNHLPPGAFI